MLSVLVVNNGTDAPVSNELSLRQAIALANADATAGTSDTITFDPSLGSSTIYLTLGQLELSGTGAGTITIDGSSPSTPVILNANDGSRVFQIDSGVQAVITNVNIENGDVTNNNGGAIFNAGTLTLSNANVSDSYASYGGGIENQGTLTLSNVTLTSNGANNSGGAIDSTGTLTVNDSTFTSNTVNNDGDGGAISSEGMLTVNNSTFSGNSAYNSGGAIASFSAPATITGCFFTGNNAAYGGVLENNAGTVTLTSDTLSNNGATEAGGAIENDSGPLTLNNTTIAGNMVEYGNGGGINNNAGTVTITNSTFSGNSMESYESGGAIENSGGTVTASNSTFFDNTATSGGAIDNESGGNLSLTNATVSSNDAANGGGIENNGGTLSLQNTIVAGNYDNSGPDIGGVITTDYGNNLLGTAVNNTTTIPTPGPNDVVQRHAHARHAGRLRRPDADPGPPGRQPGHRRRQCQCHESGNRPARVAACGERKHRHRRVPDAAAGVGFQHAGPDRRRGPADGRHHGRAGRPGRQPGPGGQRRRGGLAEQQLNRRQLLVSERLTRQRRANHHSAG